MAQAADAVRGMAVDLRVVLDVQPCQAHMWGDADRLVQVMTNLVSNAIKFSQLEAPSTSVHTRRTIKSSSSSPIRGGLYRLTS